MATTITERLSGDPTVANPVSDLAAIEELIGTGVPERTGANTWALRAKTGSGDSIVSGTAGAADRLARWNGDGDLVEGPNAPSGDIVGTTDAQTLTNKTIAAGSNAVSGLSVEMFADAAIVTEAEGISSNDNDTSLPTSAAVKDYVDNNGFAAASQAQMEAASSITVASTPGRQHFHPGSAKCWAVVTGARSTPTLATSYNVTSITDNGTGDLTVIIAADFSSANWCCLMMNDVDGDFDPNHNGVHDSSQTAGSVRLATDGFDPATKWWMAGFGDHT